MNTSLRVLSSWLDMLPIGGGNNQKVSDKEREKKGKRERERKRERKTNIERCIETKIKRDRERKRQIVR